MDVGPLPKDKPWQMLPPEDCPLIQRDYYEAVRWSCDVLNRIPRKTPHSMTMPPEPLWTPHKGEYKPKPNDTSYGTEPIIGIDPMLAAFITTIVFVLAIYIATHT